MTVVDIAKSLISIDTSGPPAREKLLAEWIRDYLDDLGIEVKVQEVAPDRANVVAKIGRGEGPGVVLSGHIDVVLAGDLDLWTESGPFEPAVRDGRLFGRGACDMKGPDACILQAVKDLRGERFRRQLTLVFTAGEDTGGWFVNNVLGDRLVTPSDARFGVIPEPSVMEIIRSHKGGGGATVAIIGRAAHSSRPELGVNAIIHASDFIQEVVSLQRRLSEVRHPLLGSTTVKPTLIKGGFKANIIPDLCEVTLNLRCIPQHTRKEVIEGWLKEIITRLSQRDPSFKAEVRSLNASDALDIPEDSEVVRLLVDIIGSKPGGVPYYTEAVSYTKAGIPTVICGPGDIEQAHTANEFITLEQLDKGVSFFRQLIRDTCI